MKRINGVFGYEKIIHPGISGRYLKVESKKLITHTSFSASTTADIIAKIKRLNPESSYTFAEDATPKIVASIDSIVGVETVQYFGRYKIIVEVANSFDLDKLAIAIADYLAQVIDQTYVAQDLPFVPISNKNILSN